MDYETKLKLAACVKTLAKADFEMAMSALMSAHAEALSDMQSRLVEKDMAFLMALSLTERGARLDKQGTMEKTIAKGIESTACEVEKRFM